MAAGERKVVTALEPTLLFIAAAAFALVVLMGIITGWVWIPGSPRGSGAGRWVSRADGMGDYLLYLGIVGAATLGVFFMALDRLRRFNAQGRQRR